MVENTPISMMFNLATICSPIPITAALEVILYGNRYPKRLTGEGFGPFLAGHMKEYRNPSTTSHFLPCEGTS